jgi:hypothetical protein
MYMKSLVIQDYTKGSAYQYTDKSGTQQSIKVLQGDAAGSKAISDRAAFTSSIAAQASASAVATTCKSFGHNAFQYPADGWNMAAGGSQDLTWCNPTGKTVTIRLRQGPGNNLNEGIVIAGLDLYPCVQIPANLYVKIALPTAANLLGGYPRA